MPTEPELLQAVLKNPDEDAPRLEYATWCEAQNDAALRARGTVIRLQIAAHRSGELFGGPAAEARKLIEAFGARWHAHLTSLTRGVEYYRGFVEKVVMTPHEWLEHARRIRELAPVRHLDLVSARERFADAIESPSMLGLRSLDLSGQSLTDNEARVIAGALHVYELRWLSLAGNQIEEPGVVALVQSRGLPSLRWVNLFDNPCNPGEQHAHDQGMIVESWMPPEGESLERRFGRIEWLHYPAKHLWDTEPNRFAV